METLDAEESLFFSLPLYSPRVIGRNLVGALFAYDNRANTIDGYCIDCKMIRPFIYNRYALRETNIVQRVNTLYESIEYDLVCTRDGKHNITAMLLCDKGTIQKIGQFPSLADIGIAELRQQYRDVLKGDNWSELYKAVGLAAHGEGIGAFVYLRRVFERLIKSRFDEVKAGEGWEDSAFDVRMDDRIELMKDHLPALLVESRRIYSIFSLGIHQLDNQRCLEFFQVGKESIVAILEDDLRAKRDRERRAVLQKEIARFDPEREGA